MMTIGQNTPSGVQLQGYVERLERLKADKSQTTLDMREVMAEAAASGFTPAVINHVIKIRAMKPHARQEAEALVDSYLHALGMASEPPIHRLVGQMKVDTTSREQVIEAMKAFVPEGGAITIEAGGKPVRLARDKDGSVSVTEVVKERVAAKPPAGAAPAGMRKVDVPDVDPDGAEALGREAFRADSPIIANPFPFGDARRPRWDAGWRKEGGSDGMGPDDE